MKATNILWDVDSNNVIHLLTEIEIPEGMTGTEEISDYLSNTTGYCHKGFCLED